MKASTKNRLSGSYRTMKGTVKVAFGRAFSSRRIAFGGRIDKTAGMIQAKFGSVERIFGM